MPKCRRVEMKILIPIGFLMVFLGLASMPALTQNTGFTVISEGDVAPAPPPSKIDVELTLSGSYGYSRGGTQWSSIEGGASLSWKMFDLSGRLHYGSYEKSATLGIASQLGGLDISSDVTWLFFPRRDPRANFRVSLQLGPLGFSGSTAYNLRSGSLDDPSLGATIQLGFLALSGGSTLNLSSGTLQNPNLGVNFQLGAVGLSGTASQITGAYSGGLGADFALGPLNLSANAGVDTSGPGGSIKVTNKSLGLDFGGKTFSLSTIILHDNTTGYGLNSNLEMELGKLSLSGTLRMDSNSYSVDTTIGRPIGILNLSLTVGFDKGGFKWAELGGRITL